MPLRVVPTIALTLALAAATLAGCTSAAEAPAPDAPWSSAEPEATLVVYSGRSEELIGPILASFEAASGIDVDVRYGETAELAATILEEGAASPADLFFAQDAGALGALSGAGTLRALPDDLLGAVPARFRSPDGRWLGVTGRARVLAYDTRELTREELPTSVLGLADPAWKGRVGWVPTNASFQSFVTALRRVLGEAAARDWLVRMVANEPVAYEKNSQALEAVRAGEVDVALVNHYYLFEAEAESGEDYPVADHFFSGGDPGALVNVAGVGILRTAAHPEAARRLVAFLLGEEAQAYFAGTTFEYPLASGTVPDPRLPSLDELEAPELDLSDLSDLEGTLRLLQEVGVI